MAHIQYVDELVKEYLLYRGFTSTLKTFDSELKSDKEKGFRVDKIIEQFVSFITSYDLSSLRDLWAHLESHLFCRLEHHLASSMYLEPYTKLSNIHVIFDIAFRCKKI